jgi:hypothetical protein
MKKHLLLSLTLILTGLVATASAGSYKLPKDEPIASVSFPAGWKVEASDESLDANSDDDEIYINIEFNDAESIEGAIEETFGYLKKNKVKIDKATEKKTEGELGGMKVVNYDWDGEDSDGKCKISLAILSVTPKKALLLLYWASPEGEKKHQKELDSIVSSIKSLVK